MTVVKFLLRLTTFHICALVDAGLRSDLQRLLHLGEHESRFTRISLMLLLPEMPCGEE